MRAIGMIVMFVLSLAVVVEAGFLIKTSREVDRLARELQTNGASMDDDPETLFGSSGPVGSRPATRAAESRSANGERVVPTFVPTTANAAAIPAVATLTQALSTPEGREQLKGALEHIEEEERQARVTQDVEKKEKRNEAFRERLKAITLTPDERAKVDSMSSTLQAQRRALFDQMKTGGRPAREIDDAIDELEDNSRRAMRTLLGDERVKQLREIEKRERQAEKAANPNGRG